MPHTIFALVFAFSTLALSVGTVYAEEGKKEEYEELKPELIETFNKPSVKVEPITESQYTNPENGAKIRPNDMIIVHEKDGRIHSQMTAAEYYKKFNSLQNEFANMGYKIVDKSSTSETISRVKIDQDALTDDVKREEAKLKVIDPLISQAPQDPKALAATVDRSMRDEATIAYQKAYALSEVSAIINPLPYKALDLDVVKKASADMSNIITKNWNFEQGKKEEFKAQASVNLALKGSTKGIDAHADARADGYVLNKSFNLASAEADAIALVNDKNEIGYAIRINVMFLGNSAYIYPEKSSSDQKEETKTSEKETIPTSKKLEYAYKYHFFVGPVPMSGQIGVRGEVGMKWTSGVKGTNGAASLEPYSQVAGFADVRVDAEVVSAGVEADLVFLENSLTMEGSGFLETDKLSTEPQVRLKATATNKLKSLSGGIYAVATVGIDGFKKDFKLELFHFPGMVLDSRSMYNFTKIATHQGFRLEGSPSTDDYAEANLDEELTKTLEAILKEIDSDKQRNLEARSPQYLELMKSSKEKLGSWIDELEKEDQRSRTKKSS